MAVFQFNGQTRALFPPDTQRNILNKSKMKVLLLLALCVSSAYAKKFVRLPLHKTKSHRDIYRQASVRDRWLITHVPSMSVAVAGSYQAIVRAM